jgi:ribonuclease HI
VKLTVDGSFRTEDRSAGIGMALRDEKGFPIFTSCRFLDDCDSPFEVELRACVEGLELALLRTELPIIIETDCSKVVDVVKSVGQDRSSDLHWVFKIKL